MTTKLDLLLECWNGNPEWVGLTDRERELAYELMPHLLAIARFYTTGGRQLEAAAAEVALMEPVRREG